MLSVLPDSAHKNFKLRFYHLEYLLALWPICVGIIVLTGWLVDSYSLRRIFDSAVPMSPTSAAAFIMIGIVIVSNYRQKITTLILFILLTAFSLKLCDIFFNTSFEPDSYIFSSKLLKEPSFPNRVAPNAALNFFLIAIALYTFRTRGRIWATVSQVILLMTLLIALFATVGHLFNIRPFYGVVFFTPMALITALSFVITSTTLLIHRRHEGFLRIFFSGGPSSQIAGYLIPASLGVPLIVGWLRLVGQRNGIYDSDFGIALSIILNMVTLFIITCISCNFLYHTDQKRQLAEKELKFLAANDPLTGLNTRRIFLEQLKRRIGLAQRRTDDAYAVFYLDVDGLKSVNDQLGHRSGDELLMNVAQLLKSCTRPSDTVARLGGDEFIVLFEETTPGSHEALAMRILTKMPKLFSSERGEVPVGLSIGIVIPSKHETNPDNIIMAADEAMYDAKIKGKNGFTVSTKYA